MRSHRFLGRPTTRAVSVVLGLLIPPGCDGSSTSGPAPPDSGEIDAASSSLEVSLPQMTPCPANWRETPLGEDEEVRVCDPWPEGGRSECSPVEVHLPGEPECRPIGSVCPDGRWAQDLGRDRPIVYVLAGASPGANGSQEAPFGTITEALSAVGEGAVIAIGEGIYEEPLIVPNDVTLWGACVARTVIVVPLGGVVEIAGDNAEVRNLQIQAEGAVTPVSVTSSGGAAHLEGVLISRWYDAALLVSGEGRLTARDLVIRPDRVWVETMQPFFRHVVVIDGAADVTFERSSVPFVEVVHGGASLTMDDSLLSARGDAGPALGVWVENGARAVLRRTVVDGVAAQWYQYHYLVTVRDEGTTLMGSDLVVSGGYGALVVSRDAEAQIERLLVDDDVGPGIYVYGATAELRDVVVQSTGLDGADLDPQASFGPDGPEPSYALSTAANSEVWLERAWLTGRAGVGLLVGSGSSLTATEVTLSNTRPLNCPPEGCHGGGLGYGVTVLPEGDAELRRFRISNNAVCGLVIAEKGQVDLFDGEVSHNGIGVNVQDTDFVLERLTHNVVYRDNGRNLDSERLPLPRIDASAPVAGESPRQTGPVDPLLVLGTWHMTAVTDPDQPYETVSGADSIVLVFEEDGTLGIETCLGEDEGSARWEIDAAERRLQLFDGDTLMAVWEILFLTEEAMILYAEVEIIPDQGSVAFFKPGLCEAS